MVCAWPALAWVTMLAKVVAEVAKLVEVEEVEERPKVARCKVDGEVVKRQSDLHQFPLCKPVD
eukprot:COSAG05_NODE_5224_length_1231_cov_13.033569_1_plen_63_part_00